MANTQRANQNTTQQRNDGEPKNENEQKAPQRSEKKVYYYWLKVKSYVSDTEIWPAGFYATNRRYERLDNSPAQYVERFDGEVPDRALFEIAERYKVSVDYFEGKKRKTRDSEEILEELVIRKY